MSFEKFLPLNVLLKKQKQSIGYRNGSIGATYEVNNEHFKCNLANKNTSTHACMQPVHVFHRENKGDITNEKN